MAGNTFNVWGMMGLDLKNFKVGLKDATNQMSRALRGMEKDFGAQSRRFGELGKGMLLAFGPAAYGMGRMLKGAIGEADALTNLSKQLGVSTQALAGFKYAANQSDIAFENFANAIQIQSKNIGAGSNKGLMKKLGLDPEEMKRISPDKAFLKWVDAIGQLQTATERASAAQGAWGKGGAPMLRFVDEGAAGIAKLVVQAKALGLVLDDQAMGSLSKVDEQMKVLAGAARGFSLALGGALAPGLVNLAQTGIGAATGLGKLRQEHTAGFDMIVKWTAGITAMGAATGLSAVQIAAVLQALKALAGIMKGFPKLSLAGSLGLAAGAVGGGLAIGNALRPTKYGAAISGGLINLEERASTGLANAMDWLLHGAGGGGQTDLQKQRRADYERRRGVRNQELGYMLEATQAQSAEAWREKPTSGVSESSAVKENTLATRQQTAAIERLNRLTMRAVYNQGRPGSAKILAPDFAGAR